MVQCESQRFWGLNRDSRPIEQRRIAVNLMGRLGNQMFEYAAGYAYAKEHHKDLYVKGSGEDLLRAFGIHVKNYELKDPCFYPFMPVHRRKKISATLYTNSKAQNFLSNPNIILMHDYFQSEKFFKKYEADIRRLFTFRGNLSKDNQKLMNTLKSQNAVSVHIRRTDYVNSGYYYVLTFGYYKRAMKYIASKVENPHFYIFSDDIKWVQENMTFPYPHTFVKNNRGGDSYIDMWLMSACKHNIIANSTFSWWGAWLNKNPDKIVIAPDVWGFSTVSLQETKKTLDEIVPKEWIIIPNFPKGEED